MNFTTQQSEINEMTDKLKKFCDLVDLYKEGRTYEDMFMSELSKFDKIDWTKENMFNQLLAYYALGTAYGILKRKMLDFTKAHYDKEIVYKEINYYHNIQYVVDRITKEEWVVLYENASKLWYRACMHIAYTYDYLGRFCEAQQYYKLAKIDKGNTKNIEINQCLSFVKNHSFYKEEEPWIVRKAQLLIRKYPSPLKDIAPEQTNFICSSSVPSFDVPQIDFAKIGNGIYEKWVNENYLRLNRFCDIEQFSELSISDNVKLPIVSDTDEKKKIFEQSFQDIRNTFINTREIVFSTIVSQNIKIESLKMSYKNLYSILDKIAVFLKAYLNLPIEMYKVDFASIWYDKTKKNIRNEFVERTNNLSLFALYNVNLDVYGSRIFEYIIDEQTKDFKRIRNFIEHRIVRICDEPMHYDDYQLTISIKELTNNTIRLAQLVRCAIIYLCNFVVHTEYDKNYNNI